MMLHLVLWAIILIGIWLIFAVARDAKYTSVSAYYSVIFIPLTWAIGLKTLAFNTLSPLLLILLIITAVVCGAMLAVSIISAKVDEALQEIEDGKAKGK